MWILQDAHETQYVLHVSLLEKPLPAANMKGNIAALKLKLNLQRMPVAAVEHRDVIEGPALIEQVQHVLGDEAGLREVVLADDDGGLQAGGPDRPQVLGQPPAIARDARVGQREDFRRGRKPNCPRRRFSVGAGGPCWSAPGS